MIGSRFLVGAAVIMLAAALVIPVLTAPAEQSARLARNRRAAELDSVAAVAPSVRDTVARAAALDGARARLAEADEHLASIVQSRRGHWSPLGAGGILVGFSTLLLAAAFLSRRGEP